MKKHQSASLAIYALGCAFSFSLWVFYFASVAYARDCPPNDPSRADCAAAAQTAENPLVPATGTITGAGTSAVIDRIRNRKRPKPATKPPKDYGPGRTNVWDPPESEQQTKWEKEGLIWDPQELTWRPPRPGEIPPPEDAPENPPPYQQQNPREKVHPDCLELYDAYVKQQAKAIAIEEKIKFASDAQIDAQAQLNRELTKFYLKFGWEVADMVMLAAGVAQLAIALGPAMYKYISRGLAEALEAARGMLSRASMRVSDLGSKLANFVRNLASKSQVAKSLRQAAESLMSKARNLRQLLTSAEKSAEELASLESKAARAAEDAATASTKLDQATKKVSELGGKINERQAAEAAWKRMRSAHDAWQPLFDQQMRISSQIGKAEQQLAERVDGIRKTAFRKLDEFEDAFTRLLDDGSAEAIAKMRAQRTAIANECEQAFQAGKAAAHNELVKPLQDQFDAIRKQVEKLGEERMEAIFAANKYYGGPKANYDVPPSIVNETTEAGLRQLLQAAEQEVSHLTQRVADLGKAVEEARAAYEALKKSAAAALAALPQYRQDLPAAETNANEAESKAQQAEQEAKDAEAELKKLESDLETAKQDESAAQKDVAKLEAQANDEMRRTFAETPEQVAQVLINAREDVKRIVEALKVLQAERDQLMDDLRSLKPKLDQCIYEHTSY